MMLEIAIREDDCRASRYSASEGNPPAPDALIRYSLNSCSDSHGPTRCMGTRTLRTAVPEIEHIRFPPQGLAHRLIVPQVRLQLPHDGFFVIFTQRLVHRPQLSPGDTRHEDRHRRVRAEIPDIPLPVAER